MEHNSVARPIERWLVTRKGNTRVKIGTTSYELEIDEWGNAKRKEGGMGVLHRCNYRSSESKTERVWLKHAKIDETSEGSLNELLDDRNKEIQREINVQKKVADLGYAPGIINSGDFSANEGEPLFTVFVQSEARGVSFYDLKDSLTHVERVEVLAHFFEVLIKLHEKGIYHCDIDLNHVFWEKDTKKIYLIDWGAGIIDAYPGIDEMPTNVKGKQHFSSPEQWKDKRIQPNRSGIYNAGTVGDYFLKDEANGEELPDYPDRDCDGYDLRGLEHLPNAIRDTIFRATRKNPEERFESMEEMLGCWVESDVRKLPCLTIQDKENTISTVSEENTNYSGFGLDVTFKESYRNQSWLVEGDFEVFMTHGSRKGQWAAEKELEIFKRSRIIRPNSKNMCLLFKVADREYSSQRDENTDEDVVGDIFYEEKKGLRILELISTLPNGNTKLRYADGDEEGVVVDKAGLQSRFIRIG